MLHLARSVQGCDDDPDMDHWDALEIAMAEATWVTDAPDVLLAVTLDLERCISPANLVFSLSLATEAFILPDGASFPAVYPELAGSIPALQLAQRRLYNLPVPGYPLEAEHQEDSCLQSGHLWNLSCTLGGFGPTGLTIIPSVDGKHYMLRASDPGGLLEDANKLWFIALEAQYADCRSILHFSTTSAYHPNSSRIRLKVEKRFHVIGQGSPTDAISIVLGNAMIDQEADTYVVPRSALTTLLTFLSQRLEKQMWKAIQETMKTVKPCSFETQHANETWTSFSQLLEEQSWPSAFPLETFQSFMNGLPPSLKKKVVDAVTVQFPPQITHLKLGNPEVSLIRSARLHAWHGSRLNAMTALPGFGKTFAYWVSRQLSEEWPQ